MSELLKQQLALCKSKSELDNIPKLRDSSARFIADIINKNMYQSYLEIGTAYGFSCLYMAANCTNLTTIYSLEKDFSRFVVATSFCKQFSWIRLINVSCFEYQPMKSLILFLVDGPKAKQIDLVEQYLLFLNQNGCMVIDNIYLKKIANLKELTKNQQKLLDANKALVDYLKQNPKINVEFIDIDDGLALITLK